MYEFLINSSINPLTLKSNLQKSVIINGSLIVE